MVATAAANDGLSPSHFETLREGDRGLLVGVDFRGGRIEEDFTALIQEDSGWSLIGTVPFGIRGEPLPDDLSVRGYADALAEELYDLDLQPVGILGYCVGASLAYELACNLREAGSALSTVMLFDPPADPALGLDEAFESVIGQLGMNAHELDSATCLTTSHPKGGVEPLMDVISPLLAELSAEDGSPEMRDVYKELENRYRAWLAYSLSAARFVPRELDTPLTIFYASDVDDSYEARLPVGRRRSRYLAVEHADLLGSRELREEFLFTLERLDT